MIAGTHRRLVAAAVAGVLGATGCGDDGPGAVSAPAAATAGGATGAAGGTSTDRRRPPEAGAAIVAAMAPLPGGGLRVGELGTGVVRDALTRGGRRPASGSAAARVLVRLPVSTGGQRGLLGLLVDPAGRTFAAFTERDGARRLVVEQVLPGPRRRVWTGPPSTDLADGGHLERLPDGRLALGVGDLQAPQRTPADDTPNGKLLALDPDGPAGQRPDILSRGWNNPFAFGVAPGGSVLVADNAPGRRPERLARGDTGGGAPAAVTDLEGRAAPSGLVAISAREVVVCGVRSGRLTRYRRAGATAPWRPAGSPAACAFGVARLTDGRLVVSRAAGLEVLPR